MAVLTFTLSEDGVMVLHDALTCVSKFSEDVCLEARKDRLNLSALHIAKSAYASFQFTSGRFFSQYEFKGSAQSRDRFFCSMYIRSLLSVFRTRLGGDPSRERDKETTIDRCEVTIEDEPGVRSRMVARIVSRNGITATHALPFEHKAPSHAKFNKEEATNRWSISSRTLRQLMDHFGPGIELLDINTEDESVVNFSCFTEKIVKINNDELLKKPLHTSIAVDKDEFVDLALEDKLHIIVNVKDFRAILQHAQLIAGDLSASYSRPGRPMKLHYSADGIVCEFVLMTVGTQTASLAQKLRKGKGKTVAVNGGLEAATASNNSRAASVVVNGATSAPNAPQEQAQAAVPRPAPRPAPTTFEMRPPPLPPALPMASTLSSESLFVLQPDEDSQWEPMNEDEEDDMGERERLGWDTGDQQYSSTSMRISSRQANDSASGAEPPELQPAGLEPTQRLDEVRNLGLFSS